MQVDVKTVQRWLAGRTPRPRHRIQVARALALDELELWPDATPTTSTPNPLREIAGAYPHADDPDAPDWTDLIENASSEIDLLDPVLLLAQQSTIHQLANKAHHGIPIRILIAGPIAGYQNPDPNQHNEPAPGPDQAQLGQTLATLLRTRGVEIRNHTAPALNAIFRFDEHILLAIRTYAETITEVPMLHLRRHQDDGLFDRLDQHFQRIWTHASHPIPPDASRASDRTDADRRRSPTQQEAQHALDRLRTRHPL